MTGQSRADRRDAAHSRLRASPLARRIAGLNGLDLTLVVGTGPHGRIVKSDVDAALRAGSTTVATDQPPRAVHPATALARVEPAAADDKILRLYEPGSYEVVRHDGMRRAIAERLTFSKQTIPHFYLTVECCVDMLGQARERLNSRSPKEGPRAYKLSLNDFIIKALALALQRVPAANSTWTEDAILRHRHSDIGVAVAVDGGLYTPIIRHAESKSLSEISHEMKKLAERARARRLTPQEYQGGTTSISNLGMYGITAFDAVINPPHATILAVGAAELRPVVRGTALEAATMMTCTLSCDHRVVDGALGANLLGEFKTLIEDPVRMLV